MTPLADRPAVAWEEGFGSTEADGEALSGLIDAVPGATLFNTFEWLTTWVGAMAGGRSVHTLSVRRGERLSACVPLTYGREIMCGLPVRSLRFAGEPLADRVALVAEGDDVRRLVWDALVAFPRPWDVAVLSELPDDPSQRVAVERWGAARGIGCLWRRCARSPILELDGRGPDGIRAGYSKTLATRLRRSRKRLETAGAVRFERLVPEPGDVDGLVRACKSIEDASWKGRRSVGIFSEPGRSRFFRELSRRFSAKRWLDIGLLRLDDRLISYRYGFRFKNVYFDYNLAFDPAYAPLSPGRILLDEMVASSAAAGLSAVDASRGALDHGHQLEEWTDRSLDHYRLWLFAPTVRGRLLGTIRRRLLPGLRVIRAAGGRRRVPA